MQKVLIISYFYPPANFVGGDRTAAWAKYLHLSGFYPIIITRQWNEGQTDLVDEIKKNDLIIEYNGTHEVHRLPYKRTLRDKLTCFPRLKPFQKLLTFCELILSNFFISSLPFSNFYKYSKKLIDQDKDIHTVIASGRPFQSFFIGHQLKKDFSYLYWIPDYRDEWNTHQNKLDRGILYNFINYLELKSELKWTSNATLFVSVSDYWVKSIQKYIQKEGVEIKNGFEIDNMIQTIPSKDIRFAYTGTLYSYQKIEIFIVSCIKLIQEGFTDIKVYFYGIEAILSEKERVSSLVKHYPLNFFIIPKIPKNRLLMELQNIDILFLTGYDKIIGWYPVKLFEYFSYGKPILLCPSDQDVMEGFIKDTNSGFVANSVEDCTDIIKKIIIDKRSDNQLFLKRNEKAGEKYSRKHQTKKLAEILQKLK
jgi:hypothetical protein